MGPRTGLDGCKKSLLHLDFLFSLCTLSVFLCPDCPGFHLLSLLYNTHNRQTSMPPEGFEPAIAASDGPETLSLDRTATGIGGFDHRTVQPVASRCTD